MTRRDLSIAVALLAPVGLAAIASPQVVEDGPRPAAVWLDEPLRIDTGEGTLVLTPVSGPREAGLPIRFDVRMGGEGAADLQLPAAGTMLGDFEVVPCLGGGPAEPAGSPGVDCWSIRTFGSGEVELPAFEIRVDDDPVTVPARTLRIASVIGADAGLDAYRDIVDAIDVGGPVPLLVWWIAAGVLLLAAVLLFLRLRSRPPIPEPSPIPADVRALAALKDLADRNLPGRGRIQRFFFELTDIARAFMEDRYGISAPERTTREFIEEAERHPLLSSDQASMLGDLLRSADLVKFAGDRPATSECEGALALVRSFVESAGPRPNEADAAPGFAATDAAERRREVRSAIAGLDELEADRR